MLSYYSKYYEVLFIIWMAKGLKMQKYLISFILKYRSELLSKVGKTYTEFVNFCSILYHHVML